MASGPFPRFFNLGTVMLHQATIEILSVLCETHDLSKETLALAAKVHRGWGLLHTGPPSVELLVMVAAMTNGLSSPGENERETKWTRMPQGTAVVVTDGVGSQYEATFQFEHTGPRFGQLQINCYGDPGLPKSVLAEAVQLKSETRPAQVPMVPENMEVFNMFRQDQPDEPDEPEQPSEPPSGDESELTFGDPDIDTMSVGQSCSVLEGDSVITGNFVKVEDGEVTLQFGTTLRQFAQADVAVG